MAVFGIFKRNKEAEKRSVHSAVPSFLASPLADFGVQVNNESALKITAFYAGVRIIAENVASLPKTVRVQTKTGMVEKVKHPAYRLINVRPNQYTNVFDFWSVMITWLEGWGNAFAVIERGADGFPVALHQVHPTQVTVALSGGKKWYKVSGFDSARSFLNKIWSDEDMLHFMLLSQDGIIGLNPVLYNAMALDKSVATEKFAGEYYKRRGEIKAVLETDGHMSDEEYNAFRKHYDTASDNFKTPLLEYGIKYKSIPIDPTAAKLLESETYSILDVCRILNIPPHMLAELTHATFSNIEHQTIQFVQYTLRPIIKKIEMEMEYKLFSEREQSKYDVKFILDGLLRGDTQARSAYYHNAILDGYMSRNEVRELEGLEHLEGLDDMLYPLNTGVVGKESPQTTGNNETDPA